VAIPHIEDGAVCWCNPIFLVPCPECGGQGPVCGTCNGTGVVRGEYDDEGGCIPIHFDVETED
jgi:hypothetical protein